MSNDRNDRIDTTDKSVSSAVGPQHVQQACDLINSIERNLVDRLADIESTMQPAAVERMHFHIITALGDHSEKIARVFAAADARGVVFDETTFGADGNTVEGLRE